MAISNLLSQFPDTLISIEIQGFIKLFITKRRDKMLNIYKEFCNEAEA